jgi:glycosyltransferase involved in cell wall biosynthesis
LVEYYLPGFKWGGPIRSTASLVNELSDEFQFKIVTRDRDYGDKAAYPGIAADQWQPVEKADVFYASPGFLSPAGWRKLLRSVDYQVIYLHSVFSLSFTLSILLLRKLRLVPRAPVVIAPRGEFSPGAIALKAGKKRAYLMATQAAGLYDDIVWHATSAGEATDIRRHFQRANAPDLSVVIAPNLPSLQETGAYASERRPKTPGALRILFLSRITRKKNLDGVLRLLQELRGDIQLDIYGALEDPSYWMECVDLIKSLPANVSVQYHGAIEHAHVSRVMESHDLFFLPSKGENFGHVVLEALAAGCPVLISDQTAWLKLEDQGLGWDLPLAEPEQFQAVLRRCVAMDSVEHAQLSTAARAFAAAVIRDPRAVEASRQLFRSAIDCPPPALG